MSSLIRREPFEGMMSLQRAMDRLLEESFVRPSLFDRVFGSDVALDVYETDDDIVLKASVPGVKPEDIKITLVGNTVSIEGEVKKEDEVQEECYLCRERRYGKFSRSVTLPKNVAADKASAEFENGVLTLTVPKVEEAKAKSIKVKVK